MNYENKKAGVTMLKLLVGIDISESALADMTITDSKDKEFLKAVNEARKATAKVIAEYDKMIGNNGKMDHLINIYEACNKSVDWQLQKICKL